jgi:hypothetical protein
MLKVLLLAASLLFTQTASAENWVKIIDNDQGTRLVADLDTVKFSTYEFEGATKNRITATMRFIMENSAAWVAVIDTDECVTRRRGMLVTVFNDNITKQYFWDDKGATMYDAEGQWLCGYTIGYKSRHQKNVDATKPTL